MKMEIGNIQTNIFQFRNGINFILFFVGYCMCNSDRNINKIRPTAYRLFCEIRDIVILVYLSSLLYEIISSVCMSAGLRAYFL